MKEQPSTAHRQEAVGAAADWNVSLALMWGCECSLISLDAAWAQMGDVAQHVWTTDKCD